MIDYDPNDSGPINKAEMLNSSGAIRTPVWSDATCRSNPAEMSKDSHLFVRIPTRGVYTGNLRFTDSGTCYVATTEVPTSTGDVGEIWVDYDITFHVPALHKAEPASTRNLGVGTDSNLLGPMSSKTSEPGSSTSFLTKSTGSGGGIGGSVLEFLQDFTGTLNVELYEDDLNNLPPIMTVDTVDLEGATPALIGDISTSQGDVFNETTLTAGIVAKAGDALRVVSDQSPGGWGNGNVVMKMAPYAKALMGFLAAVVTKEQFMTVALKKNIRRGQKIPDALLQELSYKLANRDLNLPVAQQVAALQIPELLFNIPPLIVSVLHVRERFP
jgi:hypothetical protein